MQPYYKSQRPEPIDNFVKSHNLEKVGHREVLKKGDA